MLVRQLQLEDEYGSPSLEDITNLSRALSSGLEEELGEEEAGTIEVEVSSPVSIASQLHASNCSTSHMLGCRGAPLIQASVFQGAERILKLPGELTRFGQLPLTVEFELEDGE